MCFAVFVILYGSQNIVKNKADVTICMLLKKVIVRILRTGFIADIKEYKNTKRPL